MKGESGVAQKTSAVGVKKLQAHLSDCRVQVVHDHQHDGGGLTGTARVLIDGVSPGEGGGGGGYCLTGNRNFVCYRSDSLGAVGLTSWAAWGRSGTCRCARTAGALGQTLARALHGGKGGNSATHFSKPTVGEKRHEWVKQTGPGCFFFCIHFRLNALLTIDRL